MREPLQCASRTGSTSYPSNSPKRACSPSCLEEFFSETHGGEGHESADQVGIENPARRQSQQAGQSISLLCSYIRALLSSCIRSAPDRACLGFQDQPCNR